MYLSELRLLNFKNHPDSRFRFEEELVAFCGRNGAGKTNVLDAIHLLCMCKSHFSHIESQLVTHGEDYYSVFSRLSLEDEHEVACLYQRSGGKTFQFDKQPYTRLADHIGKMPVVLIAPGDIRLIQEGSEERRRFLDMLLSQTDSRYLHALMRYQRALEQRNRQLKRCNESGYVDHALLDSLDRQLIEPSSLLYEKRKDFITGFHPGFLQHYRSLSQGSEEVGLLYQSDLEEAGMEEWLKRNRQQDLDAGRTTRGLHKDELEFRLGEHPIRKYGSQGQIKSYLIALKLAQFDFLRDQTGTKPFLLLDDIFEKLDEHRAQRLIQLVAEEHFGQIFITDTHRERLEQVFSEIGKKAQTFVLES